MPGVSIDEAARLTGLSTTTIRRRIRSGEWIAEMVGGRWMIDPEQLGRRFPEVETGEESLLNLAGDQIKPAQPQVGPVPEGMQLVPLDAWTTMLEQIGNLHQAGQDLAAAMERAGRAEATAQFQTERRHELERENAQLRAQIAGEPPPTKEPAPTPEPAIEPTPAAEHLPHLDDAVVERLAHLDEHRAYQPPKSWWQRIRIQRPGRQR